MAVVKLTIVKEFTYRGSLEEWSNSYHINGAQPADAAAWLALAIAWGDKELAVYGANNRQKKWYGYNPGSEHADFSGDYAGGRVGTFAGANSMSGPGDTAVWIRWDSTKLTSKGKKIYLRKYFHPAIMLTGTVDTTSATWLAAAAAFSTAITNGTGVPGYKICSSDGTLTGAMVGSPYVTTRTLKRRGKRP